MRVVLVSSLRPLSFILFLKLKAVKLTANFFVVVIVLKLWLISLVVQNELRNFSPFFSYG